MFHQKERKHTQNSAQSIRNNDMTSNLEAVDSRGEECGSLKYERYKTTDTYKDRIRHQYISSLEFLFLFNLRLKGL